MADPNPHQVILVDDQMPMDVPGQYQNHAEPPYPQNHFLTADEQQSKTIWDEIDSPHRGSNSFAAISNAGAVHYQRLLDISRQLRHGNNRLAGEVNYLKIQNNDLHTEASAKISALQNELRQSQDRLGEAEEQRIEAQQHSHSKQEELGISAAIVADLTVKNEALNTQVKDLESSLDNAQRLKQPVSDALARLEEQHAELKEKVDEHQIREKAAREASDRLQNDYDNLAEERRQLQDTSDRLREDFDTIAKEQQQLQDALDRSKNEHQDNLTMVERGHAESIHHLKSDHREEIEKLRSDCEEAHREQVNLSTLRYGELMKKLDSEKAAEISKWQQSYDKLKEEKKATSEDLRTAQSQLQMSKADVNTLNAKLSAKQSDLRKLRQELDDARTELADEKKNLKAVQKDLSIARNSASRDKQAFRDERATWERERGHASRDSAEQATNLKRSYADIRALKKRVAAAESNSTTSASDKARAEQESNDLRAKVKELECQIADEKLEAEEARNEVEGLRSLLYQLEDAAATQRKKMKESSEIAKRRKRSEHAYVPEKL